MVNSISTPTIEAIIGRDELRKLLTDPTFDPSDLVLISISEPLFEHYQDEAISDLDASRFKSCIKLKFWDIEEQIGPYLPITDEQGKQLQTFILANLTSRFLVQCRAGVSRSAGVAKAIECIKFFGIGDEAKFNYQTSFSSEIDTHSRYHPNLKVFDTIVKDYS